MYLLDTNICIYIRQQRHQSSEATDVLHHFYQHTRGEVWMSVVTFAELAYGVYKRGAAAHKLLDLNRLTELIPVEPLPVEAGIQYGKIRADLESRGEVIGPNDLLIAAHALSADHILVTNNEREFERVADLHVENWAS